MRIIKNGTLHVKCEGCSATTPLVSHCLVVDLPAAMQHPRRTILYMTATYNSRTRIHRMQDWLPFHTALVLVLVLGPIAAPSDCPTPPCEHQTDFSCWARCQARQQGARTGVSKPVSQPASQTARQADRQIAAPRSLPSPSPSSSTSQFYPTAFVCITSSTH